MFVEGIKRNEHIKFDTFSKGKSSRKCVGVFVRVSVCVCGKSKKWMNCGWTFGSLEKQQNYYYLLS